jgi:diaminohydroxyphosphoribosylaminopyrimidine deaminase/5-amino-6-(5-phosphoribosylamino)uracil reductase
MEQRTWTQGAAEVWMGRALELAERGRGWAEPNPVVGAVLVRDGEVIGEGWHRRYGGPHAEVEALRDCEHRGANPAGAALFVTLEPCCHWGKTPPCVDAVLAARVGGVWAAMQDPAPWVNGRGLARLRDAGVPVHVGLMEDRARRLNEAWLKGLATGLPWVVAKWAQTLDGRLGTRSGDSRWISGEASRRWVHELRARVDAVVVGIGTVKSDNPELNARGVELRRLARRVVVDPRLELPLDSRLVTTLRHGADAAPVTVICGPVQGELELRREALEAAGVEVMPVGWREGCGLDLGAAWGRLAREHRAARVLVEGGAGLIGQLFLQGQVDEVVAFVAPRLLGDPDAVPVARGLSPQRIDEALRLELRDVERLGEDVRLGYRVIAG